MEARFRKLGRTLPPGSNFQFHETELNVDGWDGVVLDMLSIPQGAPHGVGTKFMAELLAVVDDLGVKLRLEADPTRKRGDPDLFALARWYCRFGFEMRGLSLEGRLHMSRDPQEGGRDAAAILEGYREARTCRDLTRETFEGRINVFLSVFQRVYGEEWERQFRARGF
ncbi:hypothetical protein [Archangium sp.]|jgi:hypothetical protein|uniref:hypothetical protein n=1 Tax=Archangium sp. TaxID=1872627 RepID=UPI002ED92E15